MEFNTQLQAARLLLDEADLAARNGNSVHLHVDNFRPLQVREIEPVADGDSIAKVRCWAEDDSLGDQWMIPIFAVRGVQVRDA